MLFDRYLPAVEGRTLPDPKADHRTAVKYGPLRITDVAVYLPDKRYILLEDITGARADLGCAHVTGCCAGGVPVPRVVIAADKAKFPVLCDKEETTAAIVKRLTRAEG